LWPEDVGQHADGQGEGDGLGDRVAGGMNPANSEVMISAAAQMICPLQQSSHSSSSPYAFSPILAAGSARVVSAT
jgi:hypothetical protein